MIQAPLSESVDALQLPQAHSTGAPVANLERYQRHGHYPAIFSTTRTALAKRLERWLFDEGFEAIAVYASEAQFLAAKDFSSVLYAAGFMVVYANPSLGLEERAELEAGADGRYFDLDALSLPANDADAAQQVLALAEPLRIANERPRAKKGELK